MPPVNGRNSPAASQSGIITGETGDRIIASSTRPDGTLRKEIRVRPGYRPPEDVEVYKNRTAESWKNRGKGGVPGAKFVDSPKLPKPSKTKAQKKEDSPSATNAQNSTMESNGSTNGGTSTIEKKIPEEPFDPEAEAEKEARKLSKKLRQARDLQQKKEKGDALLPEQFQKVIQMNELIRQLDSLGFDQEVLLTPHPETTAKLINGIQAREDTKISKHHPFSPATAQRAILGIEMLTARLASN